MAPTTDNNARDERSVLRPNPGDILKRFHALYDNKLRYYMKKVSKLYCYYYSENEIFVESRISKFLRPAQRYDDFKLIRIICQAACHGKTEHGIFVKFKKTEQNCCCPHCQCHHLGYSVPPAFHRTIWCRSTFGPRGPGLSNPTSFLSPALPMAPTTDNNARDERSVLRPKPSDILKRFHASYDNKLRYYMKKVSKLYCYHNPFKGYGTYTSHSI